jgi:quinol monooxygenase YgiN
MRTKLFILLFAAVIIMSSFESGSTTNKKVVAGSLIQAPVAANEMMITATLNIKPDKIKDFLAVAKEMVEKSGKESGCKSYQLYQDPYNTTSFIFVEEYKDQAAIDAHFATDYFKAFGPKITNLVQEPAKIKVITVSNIVIK